MSGAVGVIRHGERLRIAVSGRLRAIADIMDRQENQATPDSEIVTRCYDLLDDVVDEIAEELGIERYPQ